MKELFDPYGRKARLFPALLMLLPAIVFVAVWFPELYSFGAALVGVFVACGVTYALSHVARSKGREMEKVLLVSWGGYPTTIWLGRDSPYLDLTTKERYYRFFENRIDGWGSSNDPDVEKLNSAVRWLIENTRDTTKFSLVFTENISYGFRRNCLGLKRAALIASVTVLFAQLLALFWVRWTGDHDPTVMQIAAVLFNAVFTMYWLVVVNANWVREAGDAYAKALLGAIDAMSTR